MWAYKSAFYQRPTAEQRGYTVDNTIIINTINKIYYVKSLSLIHI